jgi:glycosyltransferase involved in cell wall biosynthesis
LIRVYNANPTIEKLVDRVIQVPLDKEVIVVDDGSVDGTGEILFKLQEKYSDVIFPQAESFFRPLKVELVHRERYVTRGKAQSSIFEYIDTYLIARENTRR